ncbi:MAG: heme lyase CcmF/NrfE family subunit [Rickettsiales bacterium]|nr:heme lyase CcmF/NrfE family subunit [Rickettsiales bacterium]
MSPIIGFALLLFVFSISIFLPVFNFWSLTKNQPQKLAELEKITLTLSAATLIFAVLSQLCLIFSFLVSDYSVANVYQNSHHLKPFIYKISGSWGNHEGSMLLLISIISAYSFGFAFLSKIDTKQKLIVSSSQSAIIGLLAAFTAFTSNPFERIFPAPEAGLGLNPLLQDIGLALHPPMLYTGYIGFSLIFSFAIAGLLTEKIDQKFAANLKGWLFFSYGFLTLGIGLGSWWAYRELGWGGYWFWDPVENISLMPWIAATALIHCLKMLEKKEIFKIWTAFLSVLTFILCLLGIFLVRSGVLTSVHSFAIDAKRGFFVIGLILLIGGGGLLIFGAKMAKLKSDETKIFFWSRIGAILFNNYVLIISLFVVLLGTIYPIFSRGFFDQFISIGPEYYNKIFSILILPFLAFLAISNQLSYSQNSSLKNRSIAIVLGTSAALTALTFFYQKSADILQIAVLFLAIFSALMTLLLRKNVAMTLAHFGFSIIVIGIVLTSSFGLTKEINLKQGESLKIANYELKFVEVKYAVGKNFLARQGDFAIFENDKEIGKLRPQLRHYPVSEQSTNEASIKHGISGDLYLVIGNKDEQENYAVRAYYKPFIYLIWLGCFLIFSSAIFKIFYKKNEK